MGGGAASACLRELKVSGATRLKPMCSSLIAMSPWAFPFHFSQIVFEATQQWSAVHPGGWGPGLQPLWGLHWAVLLQGGKSWEGWALGSCPGRDLLCHCSRAVLDSEGESHLNHSLMTFPEFQGPTKRWGGLITSSQCLSWQGLSEGAASLAVSLKAYIISVI